MTTSRIPLIRQAERVLVRAEDAPWGQLYRVTVGFWLVPAASVLWGHDPSGWGLGTFLLVVLFALRLGPAVARRLVPFSAAPRQIWAKRRQIAKRYDSYQWQKVFWLGVGLTVRILIFGGATMGQLVLTLVLLMSGAAGMVAWHVHGATTERVGSVRSQGAAA